MATDFRSGYGTFVENLQIRQDEQQVGFEKKQIDEFCCEADKVLHEVNITTTQFDYPDNPFDEGEVIGKLGFFLNSQEDGKIRCDFSCITFDLVEEEVIPEVCRKLKRYCKSQFGKDIDTFNVYILDGRDYLISLANCIKFAGSASKHVFIDTDDSHIYFNASDLK